MNNVFLRVLGVLGIIAIGVAIGIGVSMSRQTWMKSDDASLASAINTRLHSDSDLAAVDVRADVDHGVATLSGNVWSGTQRDRAGTLAQVNGVTRVDNRIVVDPSSQKPVWDSSQATGSRVREVGEHATSAVERAAQTAGEKTREGLTKAGREVTDAWILTLVKSHYFGEKTLKGSDINVDVDRHVVTLKGTVSSEIGRARAVEIASNTEGVTRVIDHLNVAAGN
jgi:hyperosmotically inducible protein